MMPAFSSGISRSSTQIDRPARVAKLKPVYMSLSAKITVSRIPQRRNASLMSLEISFFLSGLLMIEKGSPAGRISDMRARHGGLVAVHDFREGAVVVLARLLDAHRDLRVQLDAMGFVGAAHFRDVHEERALAAGIHALAGGVAQ